MSFPSRQGNSPPVRDTGLGIRSLGKLKNQFDKEMEVLDQLEASLTDSAQAGGPRGGGDVRRQLFHMTLNHDHASGSRVIAEKLLKCFFALCCTWYYTVWDLSSDSISLPTYVYQY